MRKQLIALSLLGLVSLSSCEGDITPSTNNETLATFNNVATTMQKGFTVSGTLVAKTVYYTDSNFNVVNENRDIETTNYTFTFTYQNDDDYIGMDRKIYSYDTNGDSHLVVDENVTNDNDEVKLNYLSYDNKVYSDYAMDDNYINRVSYGGSGLNNPFLSIDGNDFTAVGDKTCMLDNSKVSLILYNMFSIVDSQAFNLPASRNIISLDDNGNMETMFVDTAEAKYSLADKSYVNQYVGMTYKASFSFSNQGNASAKDLMVPEEDKPENKPLQDIFNKMQGQNLMIKRVVHAYYDGVEEDLNETVRLYYDGEKIFYQTYYLDDETSLTGVTASDFLLMRSNPDVDALYGYTRNSNGTWSQGGYSSVSGYPYEFYLPVIGDINANIFEYDKENDVYYLPEVLSVYWLLDGCMLPTMAVSQAYFFDYLNRVEIKLKDNGDIDYMKTSFYRDAGMHVVTGTYEITYQYGPSVTMPYNIDEEVK